MSNVVPLRPGGGTGELPPDDESQKMMLEELEGIIAQVRSGEIVGISGCLTFKGHGSVPYWIGHHDFSTWGAIKRVEYFFTKFFLEDDEDDED